MRKRYQRRRHARISVLAGLSLFALSQLALAVAVETAWPEIRDPNFGSRWRLLRRHVERAPHRPLVLVFGSSRVETGFHPDAAGLGDDEPIAFNFGLTGAAPSRAWLAYRRVRDAGIRPAAVVIEVMPALFGDPRRFDDTFAPGKLAADDLTDLSPYLSHPWALWRQWLMARTAPVYASRFVIMSRLAPQWLPIASRTDYLWTGLDQFGAARLPESLAAPAARRAGSLQARDEYADRLRRFALPPTSVGLLHRWIDECRGADVAVALLLMPESAEFQALYPPTARAEFDEFLKRLQTESRVSVIDARNWLSDAAMYDGHHLLPIGAREFSARLGGELKQALSRSHR